MNTETKHRLTTDEIALLRAIVIYRKAKGIQHQVHNARYLEPTDFRPADGPRVRRSVEVSNDYGTWEIGIDPDGDSRSPNYTWHRVTGVAHAVDLLVLHGLLPLRFSSGYRAGWHASEIWHDPEGRDHEFERLFHDPENISFPAGVDA
jgi:hypothetical protein